MTFEAPLVTRLHPNPRGLIDRTEFRNRLAVNCTRGLPQVPMLKAHNISAAICAGGPSLLASLPTIRELREQGLAILAVNKVSNFLIDNGVVPNYVVLADPHVDMLSQFAVHPDIRYLVASLIEPRILDMLEGHDVWLWHAQSKEPELSWVRQYYPDPIIAMNGSSGTLRAIDLLYILGFRKIDIFGFDGSYENHENHHAYEQAEDDASPYVEPKIEVAVRYRGEDRKFLTRGDFARQAIETVEILVKYRLLAEQGLLDPINVTMHGDGLIQHYWRSLQEFDNGGEEAARRNRA